MSADDEGALWPRGVFDAHCHPTDTMALLPKIPDMKARVLTVMATRSEDQDLVASMADDIKLHQSDLDSLRNDRSETKALPSFGWHPWFSHHLYDETRYDNVASLSPEQKIQHYKSVLTPSPTETYITFLPDPQSMSSYLSKTREHLSRHPLALIGEIGIDRGFRLPEPWTDSERSARDDGLTPGGREGRRLSPYRVSVDHQRFVLTRQLNLAGEMGRAVSVHGVQGHGILYETLAATWKGCERKLVGRRAAKREKAAREQGRERSEEDDSAQEAEEHQPQSYPPRICLHSYSGPADTIKQYLHPSVPAEIFFSFSTVINFDPPTRKVEDAVRAVPEDRILIESDLHTAGERMDSLLEDIVRRICDLKGWGLEEGAETLRRNWKRFALGSDMQ